MRLNSNNFKVLSFVLTSAIIMIVLNINSSSQNLNKRDNLYGSADESLRTVRNNSSINILAPNVFVIKSNGSFFRPGGELEPYSVLRELYQSVPDKYDFVAIFTAIRGFQGGDTQGIIKINISGIGLLTPFDNAPLFGLHTQKLLGFTVTNDIDKYIEQYQDVEPLLFESYHYWVMYLGDQWNCNITNTCFTGLRINRIGHWSHLLDTSTRTKNKIFIDPAGGSIWQDNNDGTFTYLGTGGHVNGKSARFSDLTLYLMGLLPPSKAKPLMLFTPSETLPANFDVEDIGRKFNGTKQFVTVNDLIRVGGVRVPNYTNSQKKFSIAFVLALDVNQTITKAEIQKMISTAKNFPNVWNTVTRGTSTINRNK